MTILVALLSPLILMTSPKPIASPFPLSDVRLLSGPFEVAHRATAKYLLELDTNRLLAGFRVNSGLPAGAEIYGVLFPFFAEFVVLLLLVGQLIGVRVCHKI